MYSCVRETIPLDGEEPFLYGKRPSGFCLEYGELLLWTGNDSSGRERPFVRGAPPPPAPCQPEVQRVPV